ncbi:MAG: hypoxanthine phosphoribosyltransferase [Candidatus Fraserbacteria bacterium RBG_16_55_9]|uniref:Hypoxanthine phosphoribosyltransferase n=1 Tax=Fraserbacteria sp. (strain RBG_16_55_9) TaxID=1817864 RepID=A0A1F5UVM0_FRAXR|nr:MAG: hypoxanthine phosphoribosyltransferase [Candidatus Fraserbacteria bacterium RBG_16_55_9]
MKQAPEILKVLWDEAAIQVRVRELGAQITRDYERNLSETLTRNPPIAVGLLRGAVIFLSDLIRAMPIPVECDFMQIASYGKDSKPGTLQLVRDLQNSVCERHLLIVEDIVDTGQTLGHLAQKLTARGAASIRFCALIDKTARRRTPVELDYVGFRLQEDAFLVGYGLDYAEKYRNLPYIAALKPEAVI